MTIDAYKALYESSIAYGMRKALMAEMSKNNMHASIASLKIGCEELESDVLKLQDEVLNSDVRADEDGGRD